MEKVLIGFDEFKYNLLVENTKATAKYVQGFLNEVNNINGFKCAPEHLQDLLLHVGEKTLTALLAETMKQLDKNGIKSKGLINSAIKEDKEIFEKLFSRFQRPETEISMVLTIDKNKVVIDETALNEAKERHCRYITTERGLQKQKEYNTFIEAANTFFNDNKIFRGILNFNQFFGLNNENVFSQVEIDFDRL